MSHNVDATFAQVPGQPELCTHFLESQFPRNRYAHTSLSHNSLATLAQDPTRSLHLMTLYFPPSLEKSTTLRPARVAAARHPHSMALPII